MSAWPGALQEMLERPPVRTHPRLEQPQPFDVCLDRLPQGVRAGEYGLDRAGRLGRRQAGRFRQDYNDALGAHRSSRRGPSSTVAATSADGRDHAQAVNCGDVSSHGQFWTGRSLRWSTRVAALLWQHPLYATHGSIEQASHSCGVRRGADWWDGARRVRADLATVGAGLDRDRDRPQLRPAPAGRAAVRAAPIALAAR